MIGYYQERLTISCIIACTSFTRLWLWDHACTRVQTPFEDPDCDFYENFCEWIKKKSFYLLMVALVSIFS